MDRITSCEDRLFRTARSYNAWTDRPVPDALLRELYDLMRWGPTSANSSPLRIVFVRSAAARASLADMTAATNRKKVMEAPVTAILAYDLHFHERMPELFPHNPAMGALLAATPARAEESAFRNSSMQAAYFLLAARMLGLDCGPMSGFDAAAVNAAFFPAGQYRANLLCSLGYGDPTRELWERLPRLSFEDVCTFA